MCQLLESWLKGHPTDGYRTPPLDYATSPKSTNTYCDLTYDAWLASRAMPGPKGVQLVGGAQRALTIRNCKLAYVIATECAYDLLIRLWGLHPIRTTLMMSLNVLRGVQPAFRGYSQALIIDEVGALPAQPFASFSYNAHVSFGSYRLSFLQGLLLGTVCCA